MDWKEPLPGQIRPDPPDELIMIKPRVDADGKVYGDLRHAEQTTQQRIALDVVIIVDYV